MKQLEWNYYVVFERSLLQHTQLLTRWLHETIGVEHRDWTLFCGSGEWCMIVVRTRHHREMFVNRWKMYDVR